MHRSRALIVGTLFVVAACSPSAPAPATPAGATTPAASTPAGSPSGQPTEGSGAASDLDGVESAVVQIEGTGTFTDPEVGEVFNAAGRGSGFIIDPSGIAVTNNHVVTGAALLKVWVGGEADPRNAKVLGVSECSDLAVIDIDGGDYPFLEWYQDEVDTGLDIYVAGFPLGDPEYTLTRGIVSKRDADGETNWASVDSVIQHDASTNPGNSGGPVVTADGKVVGVHYSGNREVVQQFAIGRDVAVEVVDQLKEGTDVESIGVNGQAVRNEDGTISGIWVSSVQSGGPAEEAGVEAGDIITSLEGVVLATDGTMSDYCDILRSHDQTDQLAIEVLRFATEEVLEGELNGDQLVQSFSFRQEEGDQVEETGTEYADYQTLADDSGVISVQVPAVWTDTNGSPWSFQDEQIGVGISAAPDLDEFQASWTVPGVFFGATKRLDAVGGGIDAFLDQNTFNESCAYDGRNDYSDPLYTGKYDTWSACDGTTTNFYVIAAQPEDGTYFLLVQIQVVTQADLAALDQIINTFQVTGQLP
jgi:serine protease Do